MLQHLQPWYPGDPIVAKQWGNYSFNVTALRAVAPIVVWYGTVRHGLTISRPPAMARHYDFGELRHFESPAAPVTHCENAIKRTPW